MQNLFTKIESFLVEGGGVLKVVNLGSNLEDHDAWSDLDVGVLVDGEGLKRLYPTSDWIKEFGELYAISQSEGANSFTTRVILHDLSRIDFKFVAKEEDLGSSTAPPEERETTQTTASMTNDFKFEAILAIAKLGRNDLLIASHLILGLEQKCLILAMMLRDRESDSVHHRWGGYLNTIAVDLADSRVKTCRIE